MSERERQKRLRAACARQAYEAVIALFDQTRVEGIRRPDGSEWIGSRPFAGQVASFVRATPLRRIPK